MARISDLVSKDGASDGAAGIGANLWYAEVAEPAPSSPGDDLYVTIPDLNFFGGSTKFGPVNWSGGFVPNLGDPLLVAFDNRQQMWAVFANATPAVPTGSITQFAGAVAPTGWLICDGTPISRTTYAALFAVVASVYGAGDGTTTFNLPDLRGRMPVGKNAATFATLGATGGEETHQLITAEMPAHTHVFTGTAMGTHSHADTATFAGTAMGTHQHVSTATFAGTAMTAHTHTDSAGTPAGTVASHSHPSFNTSPGVKFSNNAVATGGGAIINDVANLAGSSSPNVGNPATGLTQPGFTGTLMAAHTHSDSAGTPAGTITMVNPSVSAGTPTGTVTVVPHADSAGTPAGTNASVGGDGTHNNLPPYVVVNYIIKI
jgi:microcystin-dependent protein